MMVQDGDVVRRPGPIDDSGQVVLQPGPFGLHLGMPRAQALQQLPKGVSTQPYGDDAEAGEPALAGPRFRPGDPCGDRRRHHLPNVLGASGAVDLIEGCT